MRIEKLIVRKTEPKEEIVREVKFNPKGLNLIVDDTKSGSGDSGNSVGKTTVIKIIDLCLGAKSVRELYYDADTRSENDNIKGFLSKFKVQAELRLISNDESQKISIKRDLFRNGKKYIDGVPMAEHEFWNELKSLIFGLKEPLPTFRQLIPKFVRLSNTSEDSMIRFLPGMTTKDTYDAVYSFLFRILGTDLVSQKNDLSAQLADCQKTIMLLEKNKSISSISVLRQKDELIDNDLKEYTNKRSQLSYMEKYKDELDSKRKITSSINELQEKVQLIDFEISTITDSLSKLAIDRSNIDLPLLEQIYIEAQVHVPKLQKSFQDVVCFHNSMIQNRIDFIKQLLDAKQEKLNEYCLQINTLLEQKKRITIEILDDGLLDELNVLNRQIEELSLQKGEVSQAIKLIEEQEQLKVMLLTKLQKIESKMDGSTIDDNMKVFNQIFSDYCHQLYGEKYLIAYNSSWKEEKKFPLTSATLGGNVGTGKKKAVIVAFDLAYMHYAAKMGIQAPNFVIHDKLENTHINQLKTIFEICQNIGGQYIIPILRERIDKVELEYIEKAKVLELSEGDRFFRV